ncbi:hypothetical protein Acr_24g0016280 [Actinidia rufa]|uniref:Uncharacterized protein n=1 Tax=Actinidia rufa TaxID=165716 RepID=A0A7J0GXG1_9ERIC|nr:hypothetical protein Acr_24g0016280 [Actinidia rufa]
MRFLRRIAGFLGFAKDEEHELKDERDYDADANSAEHHLHRKGFSVPVQVPVERPQQGPVLVPCGVGDGGVQGLKWYARRLRIDEDGDVADEFLDEILPEPSSGMDGQPKLLLRFEVKYSAKLAKVRNQVLAPDGKIHQSVEYQGQLQWV